MSLLLLMNLRCSSNLGNILFYFIAIFNFSQSSFLLREHQSLMFFEQYSQKLKKSAPIVSPSIPFYKTHITYVTRTEGKCDHKRSVNVFKTKSNTYIIVLKIFHENLHSFFLKLNEIIFLLINFLDQHPF